MSGQTSAGQVDSEERARRRGPEDGRITTNVPFSVGQYICEQAADLGISAPTFTRMLIVEALKGRGLSLPELKEKFPEPERMRKDKRLRENRAKTANA